MPEKSTPTYVDAARFAGRMRAPDGGRFHRPDCVDSVAKAAWSFDIEDLSEPGEAVLQG